MTFALVRLTVRDYETWKPIFEEAATLRKTYGSKGLRFFRSVDRPNEVVVLAEYEDLVRARQLFQSQEFRAATQRAGVTGPPEVIFLNEAGRLPA